MRRFLPAPLLSAVLALGLLAFMLLVEARHELVEIDTHSGLWRRSTTVFDFILRQHTEETDFSRLYKELGGESKGPPHWMGINDRTYSLAGMPIITCSLFKNQPDESFGLWAAQLKGDGKLFSGLKLTPEAKLALLDRCMHAYDLPGSGAGDKYNERLMGFFACHPSQDVPGAPALTPDDFPTPEQALDESVWQRDWLPIVDNP